MTGLIDNVKTNIQHRFRQQLTIIVICLLISILLWFLVKISSEDTARVRFRISFTNIPEGKVMTKVSHDYLYLNINERPFTVVRDRFFKRSVPIIIDLSTLKLIPVGDHFETSLPTSTLVRKINLQLGKQGGMSISYPDTLYFVFRDKTPGHD